MGATTNTTPATDYTWDSAGNVTWDSFTAQSRAWAGASTLSHSLSADDPIRIAELRGTSLTKRLTDLFRIVSARKSAATSLSRESMALADSLGRTVGYGVKLSEGIAIADQRRSGMTMVEREALSVSEASRRIVAMVERETLSTSDAAGFWTTYSRAFSETISTASRSGRGAGKRSAESLRVAESVADRVEFIRGFAEGLSVSESYQDIINFSLNFAESVAIATRPTKLPAKRSAEAFGVADSGRPRFAFGVFETESLAVADMFARRVVFWRAFSEALQALDKHGKAQSILKRESLRAVGGKSRSAFGKRPSESLAIAELYGRAAVFSRAFSETVSARDAAKKAFGLREFEALAAFDELVKGATGVIDGLTIFDDAMTFEAFVNMIEQDSPLEYSAFRRLIPGDYDYQEAIVKVTASSELGDRAVISDLNLQIDVPDVNDRGRVTCSASAATPVAFVRTFTVPPEVLLTVMGGGAGQVLIPRVIGAITLTGFTVGLFKTDGSLADGVVSWSADGY